MEKKETKRNKYSVWSLFGFRHTFGNVLGRNNSSKNNIGFTLVELLIVVAIISILAGGLMFVINPAERINQSRDGVRKSDLRQIQSALEMYRSDNAMYPLTVTCGNAMTFGTTTYMTRVPCDPTTGVGSYSYSGTVNGAGTGNIDYSLVACLQNVGDPQADPNLNPPAPNTCDPGFVSFTVRNP